MTSLTADFQLLPMRKPRGQKHVQEDRYSEHSVHLDDGIRIVYDPDGQAMLARTPPGSRVTHECVRLPACDEQDFKVIYNSSVGIVLSPSLGWTQLASRIMWFVPERRGW